MDNSKFSYIKNSHRPSKQIWQLGDKHFVIIDKSIIEKLGITDNSTIFLEQEILQDNTILMRIKKF